MSSIAAPSATGYPPRILRVIYRSNYHPRRVAQVIVKVPYSHIFDMTEVLSRAITTNEILWYRIERVKPHEIPTVRRALERWPEALKRSSKLTGVTWLT